MLAISYAGLSDQGLMRHENQDRWYADPEQGLYLIADGMGGHSAGAVAAQIVADVLPALIRERLPDAEQGSSGDLTGRVRDVIAELSERLREQSAGRRGLHGLGATPVLANIRRDRAYIAHLGDSRAYMVRTGRLAPLTQDHSIVALLLETGDLAP
jgi:PPM family protein phosphatase